MVLIHEIEYLYKRAISLNVLYWDAVWNLSHLYCLTNRPIDALAVLEKFEFNLQHHLQKLEHTHDNINHGPFQPNHDPTLHNHELNNGHIDYRLMRDLFDSIGTIKWCMGNITGAFDDFLRVLSIQGINVNTVISRSSSSTSPPFSISPQTALSLYVKRSKNLSAAVLQQLCDLNIVNSRIRCNVADETVSVTIAKLCKIAADSLFDSGVCLRLHYLVLSLHPSASACNNIGIMV
jgi:hypothetical protein